MSSHDVRWAKTRPRSAVRDRPLPITIFMHAFDCMQSVGTSSLAYLMKVGLEFMNEKHDGDLGSRVCHRHTRAFKAGYVSLENGIDMGRRSVRLNTMQRLSKRNKARSKLWSSAVP